ncbi:hypothetical protein [Ornithinimicrobium kibberense]|uniref:hypothetical protein n=1 Tax=Ornithinimicrobium kibberense TaxID=282060 RepID=UPI00406BABF6
MAAVPGVLLMVGVSAVPGVLLMVGVSAVSGVLLMVGVSAVSGVLLRVGVSAVRTASTMVMVPVVVVVPVVSLVPAAVLGGIAGVVALVPVVVFPGVRVMLLCVDAAGMASSVPLGMLLLLSRLGAGRLRPSSRRKRFRLLCRTLVTGMASVFSLSTNRFIGVTLRRVVVVSTAVVPGRRVVPSASEQVVCSWAVLRILPVANAVKEEGVRVVEHGDDVVVLPGLHAHPRPRHLLPHEVDGLGKPWSGRAAHDEDVRICRGRRELPSAPDDRTLDEHPRARPPWNLDHQGVRVPGSESQACVAQTHRSAPSRHAHRTATNSAARNRNISTTAVVPISATTTAQGYMKSISTSKARKTSVVRYHRTWYLDSACCSGIQPDSNGSTSKRSGVTAVLRWRAYSARTGTTAATAITTTPRYMDLPSAP